MNTKVNDLFNAVLALGGDCMVTVASAYLGVEKYDIDAEGKIGYAPEHLVWFKEHLEEAVNNGGGVMIRKFTSERSQQMTPKGLMMLPIKHLYGVVGGEQKWLGLNKAQVEESSTTVAGTTTRIPREAGVVYCDWPTSV